MAVGSISEVIFKQEIQEFLKLSSASNDTWFLERLNMNGVENEYIVKKSTFQLYLGQSATLPETDCNFQELEDEDDPNTSLEEVLHKNPDDDLHKETCNWEYHIVYSHSYGVPVLYFNAHKTDGSLLSLEEVWNSVPKYYQDRLKDERWSFITQQEHPFRQTPFFQLHPCHTSTMMGQVLDSSRAEKGYLLAWLSSVGPVVHLDLPLSYGLQEDPKAPP